jgi:hypothetical protein
MVVLSTVMPAVDRAAALAVGYGASQTVAAVLLSVRARAITGAPTATRVVRVLATGLGSAAAAGAAMLWLVSRFGTDRSASAAAVLLAGAAGVAVFGTVMWLVSGRRNWMRLGVAE